MKKINNAKKAACVIPAALLALLMASCKNNPDPISPEPDPVPDSKAIPALILPHGTGAEIPAWEKASDGVQNLAAFKTNLSNDYLTVTDTNRTAELKAAMQKAIDDKLFDGRTPKNILIVFGDGMGESHFKASRQYYGDLITDLIPNYVSVDTDSYKAFPSKDETSKTTTDSSAGGTAITTGFKTRYGYIGKDIKGNNVMNLAELAEEKGMFVGNVTNDHMGDATPADVLVHSANRNYQDCIYGMEFLFSPDMAMGSDYGYSTYIQETKSDKKTYAEIIASFDEEAVSDGIGYYKKAAASDSTMDQNVEATIKAAYASWYESYTGADKAEYSAPNAATENEKAKAKRFELAKPILGYYYENVSIKYFYETNKTALETRALNLLGKEGTSYDFSNWAADRKMHTYATFPDLMKAVVESNYEIRPVSGWTYSGDWTTSAKLGYRLGYKKGDTMRASYPEMVASTITILDHKAKANGDVGFFCLIENTASDGWGHANHEVQAMNEIQCFDEGVAIAIKYVLENPDTLLIVTADHETGGFKFKKGWETNYEKIECTTEGHSSGYVPCAMFGAGASAWPSREDNVVQQNYETGMFIGKAMGYANFGDLNGNGIRDGEEL